jgi:hypothetical protein
MICETILAQQHTAHSTVPPLRLVLRIRRGRAGRRTGQRRPELFNPGFLRSFLRHFERQPMSDSVDREIGQRHRTGSSVRRPSRTRIGLSSPLKPSHRLTLRMNASQKQLSCSVQEHGATMARERLPWEHRLMTKKITLEQKWHQLSEAAKKEAEKLPHGKEREALLRKARQLETASQIDQWISSPALQPPT